MSSIESKPTHPERYWRSLDDLADTPEFRNMVENEFPDLAAGIDSPASRRTFMKIMGASMALAGMTACRWPSEKILPFASRSPDRIPGVASKYATAMELGGVATGLLVTSYDGRPVKIEGNPLHPFSLGATNSWQQAAVLELYDPDRSRHPGQRSDGESVHRSWDDFRAAMVSVVQQAVRNGGRGVYVLSEPSASPSLEDMKTAWREAMPESVWLEYEPLGRDHSRNGSRKAFGKPYRTHLALEQAHIIVSLDDDFLMTHPAAVRYARGFARSRSPEQNTMSRLYVVEGGHGVTGAAADFRLGVSPSTIAGLAARLAARLFRDHGVPMPPAPGGPLPAVLDRFSGAGEHDDFIDAVATDLAASRGRSVITVGEGQPPEVHALAHWVNAALDNVGTTVTYTDEPDPDRIGGVEAITRFVEDASAGRVRTAILIGGNPVVDAPAGLDVAAALAEVKHSVRLGLYDDETSSACNWHVPRAHFLESWNDSRGWDGTVTVGQPLIEPMWDGRTPAELLALLLDDAEQNGYEIVRRTLARQVSGDFESVWRRTLHDGLLEGSDWPAVTPAPRAGGWIEALAMHLGVGERGLELVFKADYAVWDGRFANNGWLQELPDPMTRITWDNAALIGPSTATELGVDQGDMVTVTSEGRSLEMPVHVHPGQPTGTVGVSLGYGRAGAGNVGNGVGFDTYRLRGATSRYFVPCTVQKSTGRYQLATTQDHHAIEQLGLKQIELRAPMMARETDVATYRKSDHPKELVEHLGPHLPPDPDLQLWQSFDYDGNKWGMAIDLNTCIGCGACAVACQAENNIPVVGKDEVARGREMHWIRIDRYFTGDPEAPRTLHQPVTCQHCENAPCETVCPVAATVHDDEGLNVMVYNRCIGTRYCSNNCPYKVRRFNYFNNHKHDDDVLEMVFNPEVTARSRGVMEKCSFCVQRINAVKIAAKNDRRPIRDGEITTACEQSCPTRAITFGNLNDPDSRVTRKQAEPRAYAMLEELNVRPRTRYLVRLRNRGEAAAAGHDDHEDHDKS